MPNMTDLGIFTALRQGFAAAGETAAATDGVLVWRRDTEHLVKEMINNWRSSGAISDANATDPKFIETIANAYDELALSVMAAIAHGRKLQQPELHIYELGELNRQAKRMADKMAAGSPYLTISLDMLIRGNSELAISRLFTLDGTSRLRYVERPGASHMHEQLETLGRDIELLRAYQPDPDAKIKLILLEDNVRGITADMIDLPRQLMASRNLLGNAEIAGIVSSFVMADPAHAGQALHAVISYPAGVKYDIITPRDCTLLDGYGVLLPSGRIGRLPGFYPYACPAARMGIAPELADDFSAAIIAANKKFFATIQAALGHEFTVRDVHPLMARAMAELHHVTPDQKLSDLFTHWQDPASNQQLRNDIKIISVAQSFLKSSPMMTMDTFCLAAFAQGAGFKSSNPYKPLPFAASPQRMHRQIHQRITEIETPPAIPHLSLATLAPSRPAAPKPS